jgi:hypothetical protein
MTLHQLSVLKQWHVSHKRERPIEFHTWDAVLTLWLMGWLGVPAELLLWQVYGLAACAGLMLVPAGYVKLRRRLHASGRLRCDWLDALPR